MGFRGQPVVVSVDEIGAVALVSVRNNTASVVDLVVSGISTGKAKVKIAGNDSFRSSYTVDGDLKVQMVGGNSAVLYPMVKV